MGAAFPAGLLAPFPGVMLAGEIEAGWRYTLGDPWSPPSPLTAFLGDGQQAHRGRIAAQDPRSQQEPHPA